jgi:hypothetical protein
MVRTTERQHERSAVKSALPFMRLNRQQKPEYGGAAILRKRG